LPKPECFLILWCCLFISVPNFRYLSIYFLFFFFYWLVFSFIIFSFVFHYLNNLKITIYTVLLYIGVRHLFNNILFICIYIYRIGRVPYWLFCDYYICIYIVTRQPLFEAQMLSFHTSIFIKNFLLMIYISFPFDFVHTTLYSPL